MAFTKTWNEAAPAGGDNPRSGDDEIRDLKFALRERLAQDHYFLAAEAGSTDIGFHKKTTYLVQGAAPAAKANAYITYGLDVGGICELHGKDENSKVVQFTSDGNLVGVMPSGAVIMFLGAACPTGYTDVTATYNGRHLKADNAAGAAAVLGGSATLNISHIHPIPTGGFGSSCVVGRLGYSDGCGYTASVSVASWNSDSGGSATLANLPLSAGFKLCKKD